MHGDFALYHRKFHHNEATLSCSCVLEKTPEHLVLCRETLGAYSRWPLQPLIPLSSRDDGLAYTVVLIVDPEAFEASSNSQSTTLRFAHGSNVYSIKTARQSKRTGFCLSTMWWRFCLYNRHLLPYSCYFSFSTLIYTEL